MLYLKNSGRAICPVCKKELIKDDLNFNFPGNQDEYYLCENVACNISAFCKVRYARILSYEICETESGKVLEKYRFNITK